MEERYACLFFYFVPDTTRDRLFKIKTQMALFTVPGGEARAMVGPQPTTACRTRRAACRTERFGAVVRMLAYCAKGREFDPCRGQTFVCMNIFVCIGCFLRIFNKSTSYGAACVWFEYLLPCIYSLCTFMTFSKTNENINYISLICWKSDVSENYL
jgi:hypothetical protein